MSVSRPAISGAVAEPVGSEAYVFMGDGTEGNENGPTEAQVSGRLNGRDCCHLTTNQQRCCTVAAVVLALVVIGGLIAALANND